MPHSLYLFPKKAENECAEIITNFDTIFKESSSKFSRKTADSSEFFMENCKFSFVTLAGCLQFQLGANVGGIL